MTSLPPKTKVAGSLLAAVLGLGLLVPARSEAAGFLVARFGGERGNPMTDNPTALYYNPAGIAFSVGTNVFVEGLFALRTFSYDRPSSAIDRPNMTPGTPDVVANSGKASLSNLLASPFAGVTSDLGVPNLAVGLSVSVPFGGSQAWDKNNAYANNLQYPGAVDGVQRWWDIEGLIQALYVTVGGAYKLPGNVSIGVALNVIQAKTDDMRAANADGTDDLVGPGGVISEGRALIDSSTITFSIAAGVAWEPTPDWRIGVSYQGQPGFGTVTEEGTLEKKLGATGVSKNDIEQKYGLPDVVRAGVMWKATKQIELRLWGSFERWSAFKQQCILDKSVATRSCDFGAKMTTTNPGVINNIPRDWQDSGSLRISGSYFVKPEIELQLGFGWDGDAIPDKSLELSLPNMRNVNGTLGAVFRNLVAQHTLVQLTYSMFISPTRTIAPRGRTSDGITDSPYEFPSRVPDSAGDYSEFTNVLQVAVGYTF